MKTQLAAALQSLLEGVPLPATRRELLDYARRQPGGGALARELERVPERSYRSLDEVGEALAPVQPRQERQQAAVPQPESGDPPGGDAYTKAT